jgi:hypothetical protein
LYILLGTIEWEWVKDRLPTSLISSRVTAVRVLSAPLAQFQAIYANDAVALRHTAATVDRDERADAPGAALGVPLIAE